MARSAPLGRVAPFPQEVQRSAFRSPQPVSRLPADAPRADAAELRSLKRLIAGVPDQTALLDTDWQVLAVSAAWSREGRTGDIEPIEPGDNLRRLASRWVAQAKRNADILLAAIESLSSGRITAFHHIFEVSDRHEDPRYAVSISCLDVDNRRFFTMTRREASLVSHLAERCRTLEASLAEARERERKRIGRDLHDSTSQLLVGLKLCLMRLKEVVDPAKAAGIVEEMDEILLDIDQEIRSISFLLHPPRLQGRGLCEAIRYMANGFARRSGLDVTVSVEGALPARIPELEAALYRLTQEALANVHRHAGATSVKVRLVARSAAAVHLVIEDNGIGLADDSLRAAEPGVGIEGMSTRVVELGGRFSFRRAGKGCRLLASIPTARRSAGLEVA